VPLGAWRLQSPPAQGGGVRSREMRGNTRVLSHREAGPSVAGHTAMRCCMPCFSP
jgi:hypothetical protein